MTSAAPLPRSEGLQVLHVLASPSLMGLPAICWIFYSGPTCLYFK